MVSLPGKGEVRCNISPASVAAYQNEFDLVVRLIEHGYNPNDPLNLAVYLGHHKMIRYLLTRDANINFLPEYSRAGNLSTLDISEGKSSHNILCAYQQLSLAMTDFSKLPAIAPSAESKQGDMKADESKDVQLETKASQGKPKKTVKYATVLSTLIAACSLDCLLVIDYLATRLRDIKAGKKKMSDSLFLLDFTLKSIKYLSRQVIPAEVDKSEESKEVVSENKKSGQQNHASSVPKPESIVVHQYLAKTLVKEWEQQEHYGKVLAHYICFSAYDFEFVKSYLQQGLKRLTENKQQKEASQCLAEFTKTVLQLLEKNGHLSSHAHQFLIDGIMDYWDTLASDAAKEAGKNRRAHLLAFFNESKPLAAFDITKDWLTVEAMSGGLDEDLADQVTRPLSGLVENSLLKAPLAPVQGVSHTSSLSLGNGS